MVLDGKLCAAAGAANAAAAKAIVAMKWDRMTTSLESTAPPTVLCSSIAPRGIARQRLERVKPRRIVDHDRLRQAVIAKRRKEVIDQPRVRQWPVRHRRLGIVLQRK